MNFWIEQPSSEVSIDIIDGAGYGNAALMNSSVSSTTNTMSKFHRSLSMGQGWQQTFTNRFSYHPDENCENRVVMRRKNMNAFDYGSQNKFYSKNILIFKSMFYLYRWIVVIVPTIGKSPQTCAGRSFQFECCDAIIFETRINTLATEKCIKSDGEFGFEKRERRR